MKRIMLIDDEEGIRTVWKRFHDLTESVFRGQLEMHVAATLEQGEARLQGTEYDAVIVDLTLPPLAADQVISWIFEHAPILPPVFVLTADEHIETRNRCMLAGAEGFWLKLDAQERPDLFFKNIYNATRRRYVARS